MRPFRSSTVLADGVGHDSRDPHQRRIDHPANRLPRVLVA